MIDQKLNDLKSLIKSNIKWKQEVPVLGGQTCSIPNPIVVLESEELGLTIKFDYFKSKLKNKTFILDLFDLTIDELVK